MTEWSTMGRNSKLKARPVEMGIEGGGANLLSQARNHSTQAIRWTALALQLVTSMFTGQVTC